jgi:TRAP-type transport system small permease protein
MTAMATPELVPADNPVVTLLDRIDRAIGLVCRGVVATTGVALLAAITIGVVSRYVVTVGGVDWAEELPKQLFAWFIMAGVVLAIQGGNHIAVDLLMTVLPERGKRVILAVTNVVVAAAYVYLADTAYDVAGITAAEINPVLGTPGSLPFYALTIGCVLTAVSTASIGVKVAILGSSAAPQGRPEDSVQ